MRSRDHLTPAEPQTHQDASTSYRDRVSRARALLAEVRSDLLPRPSREPVPLLEQPDPHALCAPGGIHEWFADDSAFNDRFAPPLAILIDLARAAINPPQGENTRIRVEEDRRQILWIGRAVWPYPRALTMAGGDDLLRRSTFIDPADAGQRTWAIDLALRSRAVGVVIADGSGAAMPTSRRFQLAAAAGGAIGLLARPLRELDQLSAANTRWRVTPTPTPAPIPHAVSNDERNAQRWTLELLRNKSSPIAGDAPRWIATRDHETGLVSLAPLPPDRPMASKPSERATGVPRPGRDAERADGHEPADRPARHDGQPTPGRGRVL